MYKKLTRRTKLWILVGLLGALAAGVTAFLLSIPLRSETVKQKVIALLSSELESEVTIDDLQGHVFPRVGVSGRGVTIRHKGRTDVPPLIVIDEFEIRGSLRALMSHPRHVSEVRLNGLKVNIPPGDEGPDEPDSELSRETESRRFAKVIIDSFEAPNTVITLIPRKAGKQPKVFTVHHLAMQSLGIDQTTPYIATLTNPVPKGEIEASGTFGPWNVAHPARTPVNGNYEFRNANLDSIEGLAGILSSTGRFSGPLERIQVEGTTDTPDFQVDAGGLPVPLKTKFVAVVDGSNGDTYLKQVDAQFLETEISAQGAVIGLEGVKGRQVEVDVTIEKGRIEDLLRMAMNSETPILVGPARLQAKLLIPPVQKKVIDKLELQGDFGLTEAKFTDPTVQSKLVGLSKRGRGLAKDEPVGDVLSNLRGRFTFRDATASFSRLTFSVPGAAVELAGRYGVRAESLDFRGKLRLNAPLSRVVGGKGGFFLKMFDPFFRKQGAGTVLPIKITGTKKDPKFGLDF